MIISARFLPVSPLHLFLEDFMVYGRGGMSNRYLLIFLQVEEEILDQSRVKK